MGDVTDLRAKVRGGASEGRICGAKTKRGGVCQLPAGAGTDHVGWGKCKFHMGCTPAVSKAAAREAAEYAALRLGDEIEFLEPGEALLQEVRRSAGFVRWIQNRIAFWDQADQPEEERLRLLLEMTEAGWSRSALVDVYQRERKHLARTCKMALDAGVAERAVRLAEDQGRLLANALQAILRDLKLSAEQEAEAPGIVRKHLMAVGGDGS